MKRKKRGKGKGGLMKEERRRVMKRGVREGGKGDN